MKHIYGITLVAMLALAGVVFFRRRRPKAR